LNNNKILHVDELEDMNEKNPKIGFYSQNKGNCLWVIMMVEASKPKLLKKASPTQSSF
jgi:hypothetical protein